LADFDSNAVSWLERRERVTCQAPDVKHSLATADNKAQQSPYLSVKVLVGFNPSISRLCVFILEGAPRFTHSVQRFKAAVRYGGG
jgi:hypothetical protein